MGQDAGVAWSGWRWRSWLMAVLVGVSAVAGVAVAPSAMAATTVNGRVTCVSGAQVEGVYVTANSGGSGFASFSRINGNSANWSKSLPNGGSYYLAVGCGGSPASWQRSLYSDTLTGSNSDLLCQDVPGQARYLRCF